MDLTLDLTFANTYDLVEVDPSTNPTTTMRIMLVLDPESEPPRLYVETRYQGSVSGTPMSEWHNRRYSWQLPASVDATAIKPWAEEHLAFFQKLCDEYGSHWDGNNTVGTALDAETEHEVEQLIEELDTAEGGLWDAGDYYSMAGYHQVLEDTGLTNLAEVTDDQVASAAAKLEELALNEGVVLHNTEELVREAIESGRLTESMNREEEADAE